MPHHGDDPGREARDPVTLLQAYEAWVDGLVPTVPQARTDKHRLLSEDPFGFFRGTYPLWLHRLRELPDPPPGPVVHAVGDLHVENFGTWRDGEGRTVWGINDLDEADRLPAVVDLLRLAVSVLLARTHRRLALARGDVLALVLDGYLEGLHRAGPPTVLDRPDPPALSSLLPSPDPAAWWTRLLAHPVAAAPDPAAVARLVPLFPADAGPVRYLSRTAGMGSRDRLRIVAVAEVGGAPVAREAKALPPPASRWPGPGPAPDPGDGPSPESAPLSGPLILAAAGGSRDPQHVVDGGWVLRRLAPWCDRIELSRLRQLADAEELVRRMGAETASVHLRTGGDPAVLAGLADGTTRAWLDGAVRRMHHAVGNDWDGWRRHS
ncbi:MAG TPA: DUF2252 family protein [Kineosporiaceae bacterium]|nr:DUF2252 family protein [Kineosporiaceae bacterium]